MNLASKTSRPAMSKYRLGTHPQQHRQTLAKILVEAKAKPKEKPKIEPVSLVTWSIIILAGIAGWSYVVYSIFR
ncbi:hypothetical protein GO755_26590 [Spirosoma sp. HMF4905]|uniref:Uncharacterized protein n=1 Tax=Spirosoma arboris TaxID=2682092 RepID=A0A7K1SIN9_9BACT|nr:hypothetical protein [Spirosoma arboris]MVM33635.1 hypothetical protein [Spirosoma arboris]